MNILVRLLLAACKILPWLFGLVIVKVRMAHIRADLSHASVPEWLAQLVNDSLIDGLSWLDGLLIVGLVIVGALAAFASFAWFHFDEALYSVWIAHEIRFLWNRRPWCNAGKPKTRNASNKPKRKDQGGKLKNNNVNP